MYHVSGIDDMETAGAMTIKENSKRTGLKGNVIFSLNIIRFERMMWYSSVYLQGQILHIHVNTNRGISLENTVQDKQYRKEEEREHLRCGVGIVTNANAGAGVTSRAVEGQRR